MSSSSNSGDAHDFCWVSAHYSDADADVAFQSSDNHLFNLHSQCLDVNTGNMPCANGITLLPETSETLELLFGFVYPGRHPELENLDFFTLLKLAEAAEKYEVFNAMNVCKMRMRSFIDAHPLHVLNYAYGHSYTELAEEAARATVGCAELDATKILTAACYRPWSLYSAAWRDVQRKSFVLDYTLDEDAEKVKLHEEEVGCVEWLSVKCDVLVKMGNYEGCFLKDGLDEVFLAEEVLSPCCADALVDWKVNVKQAVGDILPFRDFC